MHFCLSLQADFDRLRTGFISFLKNTMFFTSKETQGMNLQSVVHIIYHMLLIYWKFPEISVVDYSRPHQPYENGIGKY